jgi:hypothetical protein
VAWLDVKELTFGGTSLLFTLETAPSKDEALFQPMAASTAVTTAGLQVIQLLMGSASVPVAQFLRWRVGPQAAGAWDVTFRILVAANAPGLQLTDTNMPFLLPPEL